MGNGYANVVGLELNHGSNTTTTKQEAYLERLRGATSRRW